MWKIYIPRLHIHFGTFLKSRTKCQMLRCLNDVFTMSVSSGKWYCLIRDVCTLVGWNHDLFIMCYFVHISSITWNYGHLKSITPIAGKLKVARPENRFGTCVYVACPKVSVVKHKLFALLLALIYATTFQSLVLWRLMCVLWKCGYCNTCKLKWSSVLSVSASML